MSEVQDLHKEAEPLIQRIDVQQRFGSQDLTTWLLELAAPRPTDRVLDIGCGSGVHLLALAKVCAGGVGIDTSEELLEAARKAAWSAGLDAVRYIHGSGDSFNLGDDEFDIVMSNFAIYYMDAAEVIRRMARHVTRDGAAYVMGSPDENAQELLQIHTSATDYVPDVYAPGFSDVRKYDPVMGKFFEKRTFHRFFNPINFPSPAEFMEYYRSTTLYQASRSVVPELDAKVLGVSERVFSEQGVVRVTKVVDTAELRHPLQRK